MRQNRGRHGTMGYMTPYLKPYSLKHKTCCACHETKPVAEFYAHGKRGYSGLCRLCAQAHSRKQAASGYFRERRAKKALLKPHIVSADGTRRPVRTAQTDLQRVAYGIYHNVRRRTVNNGWEASVTREWVEAAVADFAANNYYEITARSPFKPSLDRVNSQRGYAPDNVRVMWMIENCARGNFTDAQVIEFCKRKLGLL